MELNIEKIKTEVNNDKFVFLDVRAENEFADFNVPNSINVPYEKIMLVEKELKIYQKKTLVVYCLSGIRSKVAVAALQAMGFKNVINLGSIDNLLQTT